MSKNPMMFEDDLEDFVSDLENELKIVTKKEVIDYLWEVADVKSKDDFIPVGWLKKLANGYKYNASMYDESKYQMIHEVIRKWHMARSLEEENENI